jgi:hypothetical protein
MTIFRHFVRSRRYNFGALAKKMEANAAKQKRKAGLQARAAAQQGAWRRCESREYKWMNKAEVPNIHSWHSC